MKRNFFKTLLVVLGLSPSIAWATSTFTPDSVLYFLRRVPIQRCSEVKLPKPGYSCVSDEDYQVLAAGVPRGVSVQREGRRFEIPPIATKLCAIETSQLRSKIHQRESEALGAGERPQDLLPWISPQAVHCSGYLPFVQESGLDEEDGRLYLFLNEKSRFSRWRTEGVQDWDSYVKGYPRILELPVRGDRVMSFVQRRLDALEHTDQGWRKILAEKYAGLTLPDLRSGEILPAEWVFRYQAAKVWKALPYLYGNHPGISLHAWEKRVKHSPASDVEWMRIVEAGQWEDERLQAACQPQTAMDLSGDPAELDNIEIELFQLFMDALVRPWVCEQHRQARQGAHRNPLLERSYIRVRDGDLGSFQHRFDTYISDIQAGRRDKTILLTFMSRLDPKNNFDQDPQKLIIFSREWNQGDLGFFTLVQKELDREVNNHSVALYDYVEMLRIEHTLQSHSQMAQKYRAVLKSKDELDMPADRVYLSPQAVGELFTTRMELEDFSETSIDTATDQLQGNLSTVTRESIADYTVRQLYEDILEKMKDSSSYEDAVESVLPRIFDMTSDQREILGFGSEGMPLFLGWVRSHVMEYVEVQLRKWGGAHHRFHHALIQNTLRVDTLMALVLGGAELDPALPNSWAEPSQTPDAEAQHQGILTGLLKADQNLQNQVDLQGLRLIFGCFLKVLDDPDDPEGDFDIQPQVDSEGCQAFQRRLERGFQQLDWLMYFYEKLFDAQTLALFAQDSFEKKSGLGKMVVKAQRSSATFTADQSPRRIYIAQEKTLRPFERRRDGKALERSLFFSSRMRADTPIEPWQHLDRLYEQVTSCATDHWCMVWRPKAYMKVIQDPARSIELMPSPWGMPGVVREVKVEQILPGSDEYMHKIKFFLENDRSSRIPEFLFRVTSTSQSPDAQSGVILEQFFLVTAEAGRYDMMTALSVATTRTEMGRASSTDVKFVSSPVPLSYVHLYGLSDLYRVASRDGYDSLMRDFVDGFQISYEALDFVDEVYRKKWMPFSHVHTWSEDGQKVSINAGGLMLVLDKQQGLVFRSDGPDHMGTRYLRAGVDGAWHHHPYDHFPYGQFAGVKAPKHMSLLLFLTSLPGLVGTWLWDSITNFGWQTGQDYGRFYDVDQQGFVIKRRVHFALWDDVDEPMDGKSFVQVMPHIKVIPTMPYHLPYTLPGVGYAQRVEKLAYENNLTVPADKGVVELFQQPELETIFAPEGNDVWVLSHMPVDKLYRAPSRTYLSHVDLRSTQRQPHLVNVMSYEESEGIPQFPNLSEWMSKKCEQLPQGVCEQGFLKGLWLAARQSVGGGLQGFDLLNDALKESPYFRYQPRLRGVAIGQGEGVFLVTAFPYAYEHMMDRHRQKYGEVAETGEVAWPGMVWSPSDYVERLAEETQYGDLSKRYRQYLLYVRWQVNDGPTRPELGKPGLDIVARHGVELENQVWGKVAFPNMWVPLPNMEVIDGMVLVGGQASSDPDQHQEDSYETHVQNKLMESFNWDPESDPLSADRLNNIDQFGQDFRVKDVFEKGQGCFEGDPWTRLTAAPILAVSQSQNDVVVDLQDSCLHPQFQQSGSDVYSDQGCVCQVKFPRAMLGDSSPLRLPITFTSYRWGFAHYADVHRTPIVMQEKIVAGVRAAERWVNQYFQYTPTVFQPSGLSGVVLREDSLLRTFPAVLFGAFDPAEVLRIPEPAHW